VCCADPVLNPLLACFSSDRQPMTPGHRNEFHLGLQQAFGKHLVFAGEYVWKYTQGGYDFSILGATPITFPIEWTKSKIPGVAGRVSLTNFHGLTAFMVFSSVAARFFNPQIGGAGAQPGPLGDVFRIDHDEKFNQTTHIQYQPWKRGPWVGWNWRYDSGLVAGPVPVAPGTATPVDVSGLTPDQQFQAGLFCGGVYATPTTPISASGLCPGNLYGSKFITIPVPGAENDDKNPPRISPRNLFDVSVGDDNIFRTDKYMWSAQFTVVNLTNKVALYNFLSTFSGTHYVTPRTFTAQIGFHF
ncbi:MAG: TonB-dependent receptor, partial [Terriglobales bacterium]